MIKCGSMNVCPSCGLDISRDDKTSVKACRCESIRGNINFLEVTTHSSTRESHIHRKCNRCSFEWKEQPYDPEAVRELL